MQEQVGMANKDTANKDMANKAILYKVDVEEAIGVPQDLN